MAGGFFTQTWYRVAELRPRIAAHVKVSRHRYGGQSWYVLSDPLSGRVHRVTPTAYLFAGRLDGKHTVDEIWQQLVADLDTEAPGQEDVVTLLINLHHADLLAGDVPPDAAQLLSRRDRFMRSVWVRNLRSPLAMQIPLIDPDAFLTRTLPLVRPLFTWAGLLAWLALMAAGLLTVAQHWDELSNNVIDRVLASEGLIGLALCYPVIKILHELGHGYVAKWFGCEVREIGVMLLVFFPVPYVDASPSAALRSKWQRAGVAAAGIAVELTLAALAALLWIRLEPGILRAAAFNVMLIGGVSSLLVNGNPLLRFDGYYVLSDLIEVPNLAQRGPRYLTYLVNRYIFHVPGLEPHAAPLHERIAALIYTPLSWCYRIFVMLAVSLFVAANYFIAGVAMALVTVVMGLLWPVAKALWQVALGPRYRLCRGRAAGLTFGGLVVAALALLFVPVPVHGGSEGVIWVPRESIVRAGADGFILRIEANPGAVVASGAPLFVLEHPIADAKRQVSAAKVQELQAKYDAQWVNDRIGAEVTRFELEQEKANLAREDYRAALLRVNAPDAGTFQTIRPADDMQGRYVKIGEILGYVTPREGQVARVVVPQSEIELVKDHLIDVRIRLADRRTDLRSSIVRAVPAADQELPSSALTATNGGTIATDPRETRRAKAFERLFQFDVALPDSEAGARAGFGSRVFVRFDYAWQPVGAVLYRHLRQELLNRFDV